MGSFISKLFHREEHIECNLSMFDMYDDDHLELEKSKVRDIVQYLKMKNQFC